MLSEVAVSRLPPLGSVLVCNLEGDVAALWEAYSLSCQAPWCPVSVVVPPGQVIDARVLSAFEPRRGVMVQVTAEWSRVRADPSLLRGWFRARALPTAVEVGEYVRRRPRRSRISDSLETCLAVGLDAGNRSAPRHRSTLARHLSTFGPLKPHDWTAIGHVVRAVCSAAHRAHTVEGVALSAGLDPRTLSSRLRRYCGCSYNQTRTRLSWEWIVELALRRFGYIGLSLPLELARENPRPTRASSF
jgi:AraC-like DNA-binding protein